jgi:hypothetical protein
LKNSTIFFHLPLLLLTPNLRFCLDGKFLNLILGLQSANAIFNCPFCLIPKKIWELIISGEIDSNLFLRKSISKLSKMKDLFRIEYIGREFGLLDHISKIISLFIRQAIQVKTGFRKDVKSKPKLIPKGVKEYTSGAKRKVSEKMVRRN